MKFRFIWFWSIFGFVSFEGDKGEKKSECWFFYSKKQGRDIANIVRKNCSDVGNIDVFLQDVANSELPEEFELEPLHLENNEAATINTILMAASRKMAREDPKKEGELVKAGDENFCPHTYFFMTPPKNAPNPSVLIGLCNEHNHHLTMIVYAKDQAEMVLKKMVWEKPKRIQRLRDVLNKSSLPKTSKNSYAVFIDEPMSLVLHIGIEEERRERIQKN